MKQSIRFLALTSFFAALVWLAPTAQAQDLKAPDVPGAYVLSSAYPNPFNPTTQFSLTVSEAQDVTVAVYNMLGQNVETLFEGRMDEGEKRSFTFEAGDLPSGLYLYRVQGERFEATRQVTLLK